MSLKVNLKLKLIKQTKIIELKYNTYEKATYDRYLAASLALRSRQQNKSNTKVGYKFINDITGDGGLNNHLKKLFDEANLLSDEALENILKDSYYPVLKIDRSNRYEYYPQLNISVYNNKNYHGDLCNYENILDILYTKETIISKDIIKKEPKEKIDTYIVTIGDNLSIYLNNEDINIEQSIFENILVMEQDNITKYPGTIKNIAEGEGWSIVTNSVINDICSFNYQFNIDGDVCQIRSNDVRKFIIAKINGFYIYKTQIARYENNRPLCHVCVDYLSNEQKINTIDEKVINTLVDYAEDIDAQILINYKLKRKTNKSLALKGLNMIRQGLEKGWDKDALIDMLIYAQKDDYNNIYKINCDLNYTMNQLLIIDEDILNDEHKKLVDEHKKDRENKISLFKEIVGDVTSSSLRTRVKTLKANNDTKRFNKLIIELIAHSKKDIKAMSDQELDNNVKDAKELYELKQKIQKELN